jgi:hypothetical protein
MESTMSVVLDPAGPAELPFEELYRACARDVR